VYESHQFVSKDIYACKVRYKERCELALLSAKLADSCPSVSDMTIAVSHFYGI